MKSPFEWNYPEVNLLTKFKYYRFLPTLFAALLGIIIVASPSEEKIGDRLQAVAPIVGLVCAFEIGAAKDYTIRYLAGLSTVHTIKNALPDRGINLRPDGGGNGFPSGHTYSSVYGASFLIRKCSRRLPYIGAIAGLGAGFTALSRVDSGHHTIWQVFFGALFGIAFDVAFRRKSRRRMRNWITSMFSTQNSTPKHEKD